MTPAVRYNNRNERDNMVMAFHVKSMIAAFSIGVVIFTLIIVFGSIIIGNL